MRLVTGDFETYFDADYSLRKLTTEQYLRDPRYETIMLSAQVNDEKPEVAWGDRQVRELLGDMQLDRKDTIFVAHNGRFDGSIIEWKYGIRINMLLCTILMMRETGLSRLINESLASLADFLREQGYPIPRKGHEVTLAAGLHLSDMSTQFRRDYERYCLTDNAILRAAVNCLMPHCSVDALRAMNMSLQMYTRPVLRLDKPLLEEYLAKQQAERQVALETMAHKFDFQDVETFLKQLRSKPKFAALLERLHVEPPMKLSEKKTAKAGQPVYDYAFAKGDLEFKALLEHENPEVVQLVEARLGHNSSINESRTKSFIGVAERGTLPVPLEYAKAHTGRYGGSDKINLQNLPKRTGDKTLRSSILAPEGFEIGGADSSQVEARLLAYAAQERGLLSVFETGGDPYCYMAESIYGESSDYIRRMSKEEHVQAYITKRNVGKETVLGSGYGMSGNKFSMRLKQQGIFLQPTTEQRNQFLATVISTDEKVRQAALVDYEERFHEAESKRINRIYRKKNEKVVAFWNVCERVLGWMVEGRSGYFGGPDGKLFFFDGNHMVFGKRVPGIMLPNGFWLLYHNLRTFQEETANGKLRTQYMYDFKEGRNFMKKRIYGGALTENLIQALAFAVLKWQAVRIHAKLPVRMNVHDEWMSVYLSSQRAAVKQLYEHWMRKVPDWVRDAPLDCEFSFGNNYGEC